MKKISILLIAITTLFISCKSSKGLAMPIKTENLETNVFVVNRVVLKSGTIEPSDEELIEIFQLLPYAQMCDLVMEKKQSGRLTKQHKETKGVIGIFGEEAQQHDRDVSETQKEVMSLLQTFI